MIVRRFDHFGRECSPVSISEAARAIALSEARKLAIGRVVANDEEREVVAHELTCGLTFTTGSYRYVPDAGSVRAAKLEFSRRQNLGGVL